MNLSVEATDNAMMARCVELSRAAAAAGEYPFGAVIALDGEVVAEATNRTIRDGDITRHAEIIALLQAQKLIGRDGLRRCTLYSDVEPCAMCAYCIREAWVGRVVYALGSPVMGGFSKWNILRDPDISDRIPQVFGPVPEVVSGVLLREVRQAWQEWNPVAWEMIKLRGLLNHRLEEHGTVQRRPAQGRSLWRHLSSQFTRASKSLIKTDKPQ